MLKSRERSKKRSLASVRRSQLDSESAYGTPLSRSRRKSRLIGRLCLREIKHGESRRERGSHKRLRGARALDTSDEGLSCGFASDRSLDFYQLYLSE